MRHHHLILLLCVISISPLGLQAQDDIATNVAPLFTGSDGLDAAEKQKAVGWITTRLQTIADPQADVGQRIAARQAIIDNISQANSGLTGQRRRDVALLLADGLRKLLGTKDPLTAVNLALILSQVRHLHMVAPLTEALNSSNQALRYCAALGLASLQGDMADIGGPRFWTQPLKTLAAQAAKEENLFVMQAIYGALRLVDANRVEQPDRRRELYNAFASAFEARIRRLDERKVSGVGGESRGLEVAAEWMRFYRNDAVVRARLLGLEGQLVKWGASLLAAGDREELSREQREELSEVVIRAAEELSTALERPEFGQAARQAAATGSWLIFMLDVNRYVGGTGIDDWMTKKLGVSQPAKELTPRPRPAAVGTQPEAGEGT